MKSQKQIFFCVFLYMNRYVLRQPLRCKSAHFGWIMKSSREHPTILNLYLSTSSPLSLASPFITSNKWWRLLLSKFKRARVTIIQCTFISLNKILISIRSVNKFICILSISMDCWFLQRITSNWKHYQLTDSVAICGNDPRCYNNTGIQSGVEIYGDFIQAYGSE